MNIIVLIQLLILDKFWTLNQLGRICKFNFLFLAFSGWTREGGEIRVSRIDKWKWQWQWQWQWQWHNGKRQWQLQWQNDTMTQWHGRLHGQRWFRSNLTLAQSKPNGANSSQKDCFLWLPSNRLANSLTWQTMSYGLIY